ncbi:uncharacterized protein LOC122631198 [Vespula pensylvanica]|uniref:uncharacterized protein LOC122631198 n=1 Tax=Vespula pensylvanica TaxID=30213 RepID=UPI001CB9DBF4|nr:uncharacterized protein LOC122631198 [Vespula pensylvanica]
MAETTRKSILDVVEKNLKIINYSTYVTRISYFGEYFHSSEELQEVMKKIVKALHVDSNENLVTGLLLVYPKFYIHLLEVRFHVIVSNKRKNSNKPLIAIS